MAGGLAGSVLSLGVAAAELGVAKDVPSRTSPHMTRHVGGQRGDGHTAPQAPLVLG